jgi:hypothetical protein
MEYSKDSAMVEEEEAFRYNPCGSNYDGGSGVDYGG